MSAITTETVPTKGGGTIQDAIAQAEAEKAAAAPAPAPKPEAKTTAELDAERTGKDTTYVVAEGIDKDTFKVRGTYSVGGGQRAARLAAIEDNADLKERVLAGEQVTLVALANFNPVSVGVKHRDPVIQA